MTHRNYIFSSGMKLVELFYLVGSDIGTTYIYT